MFLLGDLMDLAKVILSILSKLKAIINILLGGKLFSIKVKKSFFRT